jgi:hypothetical protein
MFTKKWILAALSLCMVTAVVIEAARDNDDNTLNKTRSRKATKKNKSN